MSNKELKELFISCGLTCKTFPDMSDSEYFYMENLNSSEISSLAPDGFFRIYGPNRYDDMIRFSSLERYGFSQSSNEKEIRDTVDYVISKCKCLKKEIRKELIKQI